MIAKDMPSVMFDEGQVFFRYSLGVGLVSFSCRQKRIVHGLDRESRILDPVRNDEWSRCDERANITHLKMIENVGDVRANAVILGSCRRADLTETAGYDRRLNPLVESRCEDRRRAAAGVTDATDTTKINPPRMLLYDLIKNRDAPRDVVNSFSDESSTVEQRNHCRIVTPTAVAG